MSLFEFLYIAVYFLLAFGAAIAVVMALGFSLQAERLWSEKLVPAIVPLMVGGIALSSLLSGRNLVFAEKHIDVLSAQSIGGTNFLRLITVVILCIALAKLIGRFLKRQSSMPAPGNPLLIAVFVYVVAGYFLPSMLGTKPAFFHTFFYPVVIFAAAWAGRNESLALTIRPAKYALYAMMLGSLLAAVVTPDIALQPNYSGLIPMLKIRLWGLGSNANSIGPLALLVFLLEYLEPTPRRWMRTLLLFSTGCVFVVAQSKTVWVALIVVLGVLAWHRWATLHREKVTILIVLGFISAGVVVLGAFLFFDFSVLLDRFFGSRAGDNLFSLSGRTGIWDVAIQEWLRNPLFGYGPEIWGPRFRAEIGMPYAFSAHNQFMQTLSMAGALGLAALLVYLRYLIPAAFRMSAETRGVSVALLGVILLRSISETPLAMAGLLDGDVLTHFLLFVIVLRAPVSRRLTHNTDLLSVVRIH